MQTVSNKVSTKEIDLLVIGGGCAGLSLSSQLCILEEQGKKVPRTVILEPRQEYTADRSWCYWTKRSTQTKSNNNKQWENWEFSDAHNSYIHSSDDSWVYEFQSSEAFYKKCLKKLQKSSRILLHRGEYVEQICETDCGFKVKSNNWNYHCKKIIDTRPPSREQLEASVLRQIFYGIEIETNGEGSMTETLAKVMSDMSVDEDGFKFNYILPLSSTQCLVELTRFTAQNISPDQLRDDTYQLCEDLFGSSMVCVKRVESGCIPMGLPNGASLQTRNLIRVGIGGGAARPATGYAFKRIQAWASKSARELCASGRLVQPPRDGVVIRWMDWVFLTTLRQKQYLAPTLFMSLANNVAPDRLVRFLSDKPSWLDLLAIIRALPKRPLLRTVFKDLLARLSTVWGKRKWKAA